MKAILIFPFLVSVVSAQSPYRPLSQVQDFLGLTNAQVDTILKNNDDYNQSAYQKQNRIQQVQTEIAQYTSAEALDPMEIGIRYVEIENLCRQMKDAAINTQKKNIAVLNDDQKAKLKVLDDGLKLMPVISQAQSAGMLGTITSAPYGFTSSGGGTVSGAFLGGMSGCYVPVSGIITGNFGARVPTP